MNTLTSRLNKYGFACLIGVSIAVFILALVGAEWAFQTIHYDFREGYYPGAFNLKNGDGYLDNQGQWITHWPPGYSLFLMFFVTSEIQETYTNLRWSMGALAVLNVILLYRIIRQILPTLPVTLLLPLVVFWPPLIPMLSPGGSELLFMVLVNFCIFLLLKVSDSPVLNAKSILFLLVTGLFLGLAALTKTIGVAIFCAAVIGVLIGWRIWTKPTRMLVVVVLASGFSFAVVPWMKMVQEHTGEFVFTTAANFSISDGLDDFPENKIGQQLIELLEQGKSPGQAVVHVFKTNPAESVKLFAVKLIRPWYKTFSGKFDAPLMFFNLPVVILFLIAVFRSFVRWNRLIPIIIIMLGTIAACWLSAFVVKSIFRYMAPVIPLVLIVIAWHLNDWANVKRASLK